ncbi:MAG: FliM/FliN family flagellar motor switch protein [Candidatus Acidiferrales bacterium]
MTDEAKSQLPAAAQDYARLWAESTARVLEQLKGVPFACTPLAAAVAGTPEENVSEKLCLQGKASGSLAGEQAFELSPVDGLRFAQMLMPEPLDAGAAFTPAHADALNEIFRQFAGMAATACKARFSGDAAFDWTSTTAPEWPAAAKSSWIFAAPQTPPMQWTLLLSASLLSGLIAAAPAAIATAVAALDPSASPASSVSSPAAAVAKSAASVPQSAALANSAGMRAGTEKYSAPSDPPANLDLLLDVVLDASLRFGQREMLLRDILELRPGSVIELNRNVQEPAELLVGGRVIARGDVVIVDGNYGLRITDITKPRERLESIETGE